MGLLYAELLPELLELLRHVVHGQRRCALAGGPGWLWLLRCCGRAGRCARRVYVPSGRARVRRGLCTGRRRRGRRRVPVRPLPAAVAVQTPCWAARRLPTCSLRQGMHEVDDAKQLTSASLSEDACWSHIE